MAGPLTWRDVAAPNFAPAMQGYQMFSDLLNNAFTSAERGLAKYDNQRNEAANRVAMFNAVAEQDPEQLKAKLASGELFKGLDLSRISPETIAATDNRVNALLNRDLTSENLNQTRYTNQRTQADNSMRDKAAPYLAKIIDAQRSGDANAIAAAQDAYNKAGISLPWQDLLPTATSLEGIESSNLSQKSTQQGLEQNATRFGWDKQDREDDIAAADYLGKIGPSTAGDPELLLGTITNSDLSPGVRRKVFERLERLGISPIGNNGSGGASGSGGGYGGDFSMGVPQQEVVQRFRNSSMSNNAIAGFLGNFHVEGGYGGAQGDGGSASGIAQWRGSRRDAFVKRYGVDPSKATATQQADYVIWELTTPEGRKSAGLSDQQARAILDAKSPAEAADLIDRYYERSSGAHRNRRINAADAANRYLSGDVTANSPIANSVSQMTSMRSDIDNVRSIFENGWNASANKSVIAQEMTKKGGMLEGADRAQISDMIENIKNKTGVNYAIAGNILAQSLKKYKPADWRTLWGTTEDVYAQLGTSGYTVDADKLKWFMGQFARSDGKGVLGTVERGQRIDAMRAQLPVLNQQVLGLRAKEQTIAKQGGNTREAQENFNRVRAQRQEAEAKLRTLQSQIESAEVNLDRDLNYKPPSGNSIFTVRPAGSKPMPKDETNGSLFRIRPSK